VTGWLVAGTQAALAFAALGAWLASRALVQRRVRYTHALDDEAPSAALTIADALTAGHSIESAVALAARTRGGPVGSELRRLSCDIELGVPIDGAIASLRRRAGSRGMDLILATISVQRRFGGNLAGLLRGVSDTLEEQARDEREARVATSQARLTANLVVAMPLLGMLVAEFASPGMLGRILGAPSGRLLIAAALCLQAMGMVAIRRIGRVET
jgi:tight adherence protein B